MPTTLNLTTSPNISLDALSSSPGANMESAANSELDTFLHNSNHPQRGAAAAAAENIAQIAELEDSPTDDAPKKKKTLAAFQLSVKAIPDDVGHIKVSSS